MVMEIGKQIKNLRVQKGVTQEELANHLGISYQAVSKWENDITLPDIQLLPILSVYFGVTIDELFEISNESQIKRIENMLESERFISDEKFKYTEEFLQTLLKGKDNKGEAYYLLAELYNHRSKTAMDIASDYARKALIIDPVNKNFHNALVRAENGAFGDFYCNRHHSLIEYYKGFIKEHPEERRGYVFLFDQLMDDRRFKETRYILDKIESLGSHVENIALEGDLELALGNIDKAIKFWNKNVEENSKEWGAYFLRGERFVNIERYKEALEDYKKSIELQPKPRIVDPLLAMAQVYEILCEYDNAIEAHKEKISIIKNEYGIFTGELIDESTREIERLSKLYNL